MSLIPPTLLSPEQVEELHETPVEMVRLYSNLNSTGLNPGEELPACPIRQDGKLFRRFFIQDRELIDAVWSPNHNVWTR